MILIIVTRMVCNGQGIQSMLIECRSHELKGGLSRVGIFKGNDEIKNEAKDKASIPSPLR